MTGWLRNLFGGDKAYDAAIRSSETVANANTSAGKIRADSATGGANTLANAFKTGADIAAGGATAAGDVAAGGAYDAANELAGGFTRAGDIGANAATAAGYAQNEQLQKALDYLQQREQLPNEVGDNALRGLADYFKSPSQPKTQEQLISEAMSSPLYAQIMGTKKDALDSIAGYKSATGGLRSGGAQAAFGREAQKIDERALLESFNQSQNRDDYLRNENLTGLAGLASLAKSNPAIAQIFEKMGINTGNAINDAGGAKAGAALGAANAQAGGIDKATQAIAEAIRQAAQANSAGAVGAGNATAQGQISAGNAIAEGVLGQGKAAAAGGTAAAQSEQDAMSNATSMIIKAIAAYFTGGASLAAEGASKASK